MNVVDYSVAAVGSVSSKSTFSGTPYHFWATAKSMGYVVHPWEPDMSVVGFDRKLWNLGRLVRFQRPGGYQYSPQFEEKLIRQIPHSLLKTSVISFNQHFPSPDVVHQNGGKLSFYIDATFRQLLDRYGINDQVGASIRDATLKSEARRFEKADHIFTMQQWAKDSVVNDYGISSDKVNVVLPGANIMFDPAYKATMKDDEPFTKAKPLVLGFVGKDWKRKGLLTLVAVRDILATRGHHVVVRCAGFAPEDFDGRPGVEFSGFIDKHNNYSAFISFLESVDIGCLFSEAEFSSISVLEFISVGRPVSGYVVDGMGDLFMPELSIRHMPGDTLEKIADGFERYITDATFRSSLKKAALGKCEYVRWPRAVMEVFNHLRHG
jgi:glycosyltransferase involved in cell wall biosynthesis